MNPYTVWGNRIRKFTDNPLGIFYFLRRKLYDQFTVDRHVPFYKTLRYLSPEETFNRVIDQDCSIVRLGDGEFGLMRGASVYFNDWRQQFKKDLQQALLKVASSHDSRILLCIPGEHLTKTKKDLEQEGRSSEFDYWINSKALLYKLVDKNQEYGSSFAFHPAVNTGIDYKKLKSYLDKKNVIIITSNLDRFKDIRLGKTTYLIEAPKSDGWNKVREIRSGLSTLVAKEELEKKETLVMVSMGPAAKVFVYELAQEGYTAWDCGQFFDLAYHKIKEMAA